MFFHVPEGAHTCYRMFFPVPEGAHKTLKTDFRIKGKRMGNGAIRPSACRAEKRLGRKVSVRSGRRLLRLQENDRLLVIVGHTLVSLLAVPSMAGARAAAPAVLGAFA